RLDRVTDRVLQRGIGEFEPARRRVADDRDAGRGIVVGAARRGAENGVQCADAPVAEMRLTRHERGLNREGAEGTRRLRIESELADVERSGDGGGMNGERDVMSRIDAAACLESSDGGHETESRDVDRTVVAENH